jgi:hypothetical protein
VDGVDRLVLGVGPADLDLPDDRLAVAAGLLELLDVLRLRCQADVAVTHPAGELDRLRPAGGHVHVRRLVRQ